jgi:hypothetical protein
VTDQTAASGPGIIGAFNRSYYEDVLVPRVHGEIPAAVLAQRYDDINSFERRLSDDGVVLVKCFLPIADSCGRGPPTFSGRIVRRWMTADRPLRSGVAFDDLPTIGLVGLSSLSEGRGASWRRWIWVSSMVLGRSGS